MEFQSSTLAGVPMAEIISSDGCDMDMESSYDKVDETDSVSTTTTTTVPDPYEEMPVLENMSNYRSTSPRRTTTGHNSDKTAESVFVTLARYLFPNTDESMLPSISLETIFSKCKYLVLQWTESSSLQLTSKETEFLNQFFLKPIGTIDMTEWEYLRNLYVSRDTWFTQYDTTYTVTVNQLPSTTKLLPHLPLCRSLSRTRALMDKYVSVVNLGRPCDTFKKAAYAETTTSVRRSARLQKRAGSIIDALDQLDRGDTAHMKIEDWPFDIEQQDSGFDEAHVDSEGNLFQFGVPDRQLSRDHFHYPNDQLISETGLTAKEEEAFEGLETQLETYFAVPKKKRYRTKSDRNMEALRRYQALALRFVSPSTSASAQVSRKRRASASDIELVLERRASLRSSKSNSTAGSDIGDMEIISEEKAFQTSLRVPNEFASLPTPQFLAEFGDKYLKEKDFVVSYDSTVEFPVEFPLVLGDISTTNVVQLELPFPEEPCVKEMCLHGCVCESLQTRPIERGHCGKIRCMFQCLCVAKAIKVEPKDTRDIRLSLRSQVRKWKHLPCIEHILPKTKHKRTSSVIADEEKKRKRFKTTQVKQEDGEDNYMADIDRAEISTDDGTGSFTPEELEMFDDALLEISPVEDPDFDMDPPDDAYMSDDRSLGTDDRMCDRVESECWSPTPTSVSEVRTPPAPTPAPKSPGSSRTGNLYTPLPLDFTTAVLNDRTVYIVRDEDGENVLIHWRDDCEAPRVNPSVAVQVETLRITTILTLPLPSSVDTFYLFKLPSVTNGHIEINLFQTTIVLSLNKLHQSRLRGKATNTTRVKLPVADKRRLHAAAGHSCDVYVFPTVPHLLVVGPFPASRPDHDIQMSPDEPLPKRAPLQPPHQPIDWNGKGDLIPTDYLEKCLEDFMIEVNSKQRRRREEKFDFRSVLKFPSVGDWS